jgi:TRAP-type C4-dicarboxylate transport system substrate-binding protein
VRKEAKHVLFKNPIKEKQIMKKVIVTLVIAVLMSAVIFSGCAKPVPAPTPAPTQAPAPAPAPEPIVLNAVTALSDMDPEISVSSFAVFTQKVKELSKGDLTIERLGGAEVIGPFDQAMGVKKGVVDISFLYAAAYEGLVPGIACLSASLMPVWEDRETGVFDIVTKMHEDAGLVYLGRGGHSMPNDLFYIWSNEKKVTKPEDLSGLRIGGISPASDRFLEALKATSVIVPPPEVYTAIDRGLMEGFWCGKMVPWALGSHKLHKYMIDHSYFMDNHTYIMNQDAWNKLPKHLQDALMDAVAYQERESLESFDKAWQEVRKSMQDEGMEFIKFSKEDHRMFLETAYKSEWDYLVNTFPEYIPELRKKMYDPYIGDFLDNL